MNKIEIQIPLNEKQKEWKKQQYEKLIKETKIQEWLNKNALPETFVYEHIGKFSDWIEAVKLCEHCQGLAYCAQKVPGHYMDLYMDDFLNFGVHRCHFYKAFEKQLSHGKYYVGTKLSKEQLLIDLTKMDLKEESLDYKKVVAKVIQVWNEGIHRKGLFLCGKPGVGKTYLAIGMTNFYAKQKISCAFVNIPTFLSELKRLFHDQDAMEKKLRELQYAKVLIADDIGGESVTAWSRDEILLPLLNQRMEEKKLTIFTSNYRMEELKERYTTTSNGMKEPVAAQRLMERIMTLSEEVFVKGESRR